MFKIKKTRVAILTILTAVFLAAGIVETIKTSASTPGNKQFDGTFDDYEHSCHMDRKYSATDERDKRLHWLRGYVDR